jgi:hypothetical protein
MTEPEASRATSIINERWANCGGTAGARAVKDPKIASQDGCWIIQSKLVNGMALGTRRYPKFVYASTRAFQK